MTKKGKSDANVANGELINTLVILSGDLVQVVTKGVLLPADGVARNMSGDRTEAVMSTISSDECSKNGVKKLSESAINKKGGRVLMQNGNSFHGVTPTRAGKEHGGRNMPLNHIENASELKNKRSDEVNLSEDDKVHDTKMTSKLFPFGVSCDPSAVIVQRDIQCCERTTSEYTSSGSSTLLNPAANVSSRNSETTSTEMIPHGSELNKNGKESKLSPGAKVFSPSFTKPIAATSPSVPPVASMGFIPTN